ncbi:MAG TPA: Sec-independent protein translocase protein TatB [Chloroflexota bacterium]|jgi:Tat protein translocase TatB subunit|nr:Sec-independent protein translocase protein TatB [Chloroflexota bacterium]
MEFMGIGLGELLLILVLALVVIGPERLPEVANQLGRTLAELRRQANQLSEEFQQSLQLAAEERRQQRLAAMSQAAASGPYCAQCGARSSAGARYCSNCGHCLVEPPATTRSAGGG